MMDDNYNSKYLTWMKKKNNIIHDEDALIMSKGPASAFDEGGLMVWPPPSRSYSCGFCSRQFRSAQALGGHMNVHRRDRARLMKHLHEHDDDDQKEEPATQQPRTNTIHSGYTTSNSSLSWEKEACDDDHHLHLCIGLNLIGGEGAAAADCKRHKYRNAGCSKRAKVISATHDDDDVLVLVPTLPCFLQPCSRSRSRSCDHTHRPTTTTNAYDHLDLELRLATPNYY